MKKILFVILLFISLVSQAQMKATPHIKEYALGSEVTYMHYAPKTPSDVCLIFLHGSGEKGPLDGTLLSKVEIHGYPKHAKNGFEFTFNIVAPQSSGEHRNLMKFLPGYLKLKYGYKVIIVTGLSMGGYGTYDAELTDNLNSVYAIAPVCGAGRITDVLKYPAVKAWHFHGELDKIVTIGTARGFINKYNSTFPDREPIKLTIYPGVGHDAWNKAYSVVSGQDELLKWINLQFQTAPRNNDVEQLRTAAQKYLNEIKSQVSQLDSTLNK